jgi:hypothetical protein
MFLFFFDLISMPKLEIDKKEFFLNNFPLTNRIVCKRNLEIKMEQFTAPFISEENSSIQTCGI